jgi:putative hemolysin
MALVIILLLIVLNGLFSMSEIAVVASSRIKLEERARRGSRKSAAALSLAEAPTRFLSTVQVGITLVGILCGAFGEAAIGSDLARWLARYEPLARVANEIATVVVVLGVTYLSVVIGELVPKRLAMSHPEAIATATARPMAWLSRVAAPAVAFLTLSTNALLALFRVKTEPASDISEEEVRGMIKKGVESGVFHKSEHALIQRVLDLGDVSVKSMMVPRTDVVWINEADPPEEVLSVLRGTTRSHLPICRGSLDRVVGVLHVKDVLDHATLPAQLDLRALGRPPIFVPERIRAINLFELFETARTQIGFVLDEHGGIEGVITLNDLVAAIVGRVVGPTEEVALEVRRQDGSWLLDGTLPLRRLREIMGVDSLPVEEHGIDTLAGFVFASMGRIPKAGDVFETGRFRFEVVDMDGRRVDKVLVTIAPPPADGDDPASA